MSEAPLPGGTSVLGRANKRNPGIGYLPQLLAKLDADPHHAGKIYEELRRRLILFFCLRRPSEAEDLADEVLDRVARRLAEGVEIQKVEFYIVGVARFVLRERDAASRREERAHEDIAHVQRGQMAVVVSEPSSEAHVVALGNCLERLQDAERSMILTYYGADGSERMRVRQKLAQQLHISLNALHNRALRLRNQLEHCVEMQITKKGPSQ
jgi:DNA-directed RNA polymerase specialized sigma24 family protein